MLRLSRPALLLMLAGVSASALAKTPETVNIGYPRRNRRCAAGLCPGGAGRSGLLSPLAGESKNRGHRSGGKLGD